LAGENFYATQLHNWPVLWIYFCAAALLVSDATGLAFSFLVKLGPIAADVSIAVLLCFGARRDRWWLPGLAYALHPIAVLISGYHGQFDSLMLAPAFLAWRLFEARHIARSGLAMGLAVWFKPVPLVLLPVLLPRLPTWRERAIYVVLSGAPAGLGTLPYLIRWPEDVAVNFLGYSSWFGMWGYPVAWMAVEYLREQTIPWWLPDPCCVSDPLRVMFALGRWVLLGALASAWIISYRRGFSALHSIVLTFAVFYFATVGFGLQYLLWIVPFALAGRDRMLWPFTLSSTAVLVTAYLLGEAYNAPAGLLPDAERDTREFLVKLATLPTWLLCGLWAATLLTRHRPAAAPVPRRTRQPAATPARATDST
jgi:hypothetical protein